MASLVFVSSLECEIQLKLNVELRLKKKRNKQNWSQLLIEMHGQYPVDGYLQSLAYVEYAACIDSSVAQVALMDILWTWNGAKLPQLKEPKSYGVYLMNFLALAWMSIQSVSAPFKHCHKHTNTHTLTRMMWMKESLIHTGQCYAYWCYSLGSVFIFNATLLLGIGIGNDTSDETWWTNFMVKRHIVECQMAETSHKFKRFYLVESTLNIIQFAAFNRVNPCSNRRRSSHGRISAREHTSDSNLHTTTTIIFNVRIYAFTLLRFVVAVAVAIAGGSGGVAVVVVVYVLFRWLFDIQYIIIITERQQNTEQN